MTAKLLRCLLLPRRHVVRRAHQAASVDNRKPRLVDLVLTQNSNALPAMWLEGRFCAIAYPVCPFSSGVS
jgi:hypothetical protein